MSCHQTASVPDQNNHTPAIIYQFGDFETGYEQCAVTPNKTELEIDQIYFESVHCATAFTGPADIVPPPNYASGSDQWISLDFSLQLEISLTEWQEWQSDKEELIQQKKQGLPVTHKFDGDLPGR